MRHIMGLPITVDIPNCQDNSVFEVVFTRFHEINNRYSTYKKDSEVSRFQTGELDSKSLSGELKKIISECRKAQKWTDGYFSAWAAGIFDPSGYVKGWAIDQAGKIIETQGYKTYCISAGGDILASSDSDKVWQIGIQDPHHKNKILNPAPNLDAPQSNCRLLRSGFEAGQATLQIKNGAVCTSGNYERGAHIINPKTKQPAAELLSVTIIGTDIIKADILATACFAMGQKAAKFMKSQKDYQALIIGKETN